MNGECVSGVGVVIFGGVLAVGVGEVEHKVSYSEGSSRRCVERKFWDGCSRCGDR